MTRTIIGAILLMLSVASAQPSTQPSPREHSVPLPEGNYTVALTFGDETEATDTTVKAETRRLMLENVRTRPGEMVTRSFTVNIRTPALADGRSVKLNDREKGAPHWDDQLSLEFTGPNPRVRDIKIVPSPADTITVYLAGDSTVTDQRREPYSSWGQMIPRFFKPNVAVANHAESGRALRSFRAERRLDKILSTIKPGDWLLIQFGHNDMKEKGEGIGAFTSFKRDLKQYVADARQRGANVVLLTPMHRRRFDADGKVTNSHGDYPEAIRQVARQDGVPLIDLQAMSAAFYEALGPEKSKLAFLHYPANTFPDQAEPIKDDTHFSEYGGYELARCVVEGIRAANIPLAQLLADDVKPFDPSHPDPPPEQPVKKP